MITESITDGSTKVTFGYNGKMQYPTNLLIPVFKNKIGHDMEENLQTLKSLLEEDKNGQIKSKKPYNHMLFNFKLLEK